MLDKLTSIVPIDRTSAQSLETGITVENAPLWLPLFLGNVRRIVHGSVTIRIANGVPGLIELYETEKILPVEREA